MSRRAELYACVYAKELPAQALLRLRTELGSRPCVVLKGEPPLQSVCSLNKRAGALGVRCGMTRTDAEMFPEVTILTRCEAAERATRALMLECAGVFSPRVEDRSEGTELLCGIDIAGTEKLFGPPEALAHTLLQRLRELGLTACVTVSRNLAAAVCLAKSLPGFSARVIPEGEERRMLAPLPLRVLDLPEAQAETFERWGIRTLAMLADLPEDGLIARMGQRGKRLLQMAKGELPHLFRPEEPPFRLEEQMELDTPVEHLDSLLFVVGAMLDQLILRATTRALALASVTVRLRLEGGGSYERTVRPALPSTDKQFWIKLLQLDLNAHPPGATILWVALTAEPGDSSKVQLGLFSPQLPEPTRLDVTLARIRAMVGEENVGCAVLEDTHAPEAYRVEPFTLGGSKAPVIVPQARLGLRSIRPPETIAVTMQEHRPARFYFRSVLYTVERVYGPWVTNGNWWNEMAWSLEQWDVSAYTQDGARLCGCMVRDMLRNLWQMRALYD